MFDLDGLDAPVSFCGGGGSSGGGSNDGPDPITEKMDRDNSATQQSLDNALGNDNAWSETDTRAHAAQEINGDANGWSDNPTGSIGGCTGCHDGAYDTHY